MIPAAGRPGVLVIDEHPFQRRTLARRLSGLGVPRVLEAAGAADALELLRASSGSLALIVSDVGPPEAADIELLRRLAAEAPRASFALVSALDRTVLKPVEARAAECGLRVIGVLEKPPTDDALRAVLVRALATDGHSRTDGLHTARVARLEASPRVEELEPWFEPRLDLRTAHVRGAEVLVRWCRPGEAALGPVRLVEAAAAGLRGSPTVLALAACAARHLKQLPARELTLSIGVCPELLDEPRFADALVRTLAEEGASPREVVLEITAAAGARGEVAALDGLAPLRMRGFDLSLGGFGTGSCSLSQLVRAPLAELRIARALVSRLAGGGPDRLLVDSLILLARRLGLRSAAQGIETQAELDILVELGCEIGQGPLFAKPMAPAEWLRWMQGPSRPMWEPAPLSGTASR